MAMKKFTLFLMLAAAVPALADTMTLSPVADTSLFESSPNNNLGGLISIPSGTIRTLKRSRALFKFDVSQIPSNATITSVRLALQVTMTPPALTRAPSNFELHRVLRDWGEGTGATTLTGSPARTGQASWNNRFHPSTPWTPPGGGVNVDYAATASSVTLIDDIGRYTFTSTASLVADVQAWIANPSANFGWMLISQSEAVSESARRFGTREDPSNAPSLVVDFSVVPLSVQIEPAAQTVTVGSPVTFTAVAAGAPPLSYQWLFQSNAIANATNDTLLLSNVQTNDSGNYTVTVSNPGGSVTSQPASLAVVPPTPGLPLVSITAPTNGAKFHVGIKVLLAAQASESNGTISQVEFFLGNESVGRTNGPYEALLTNLVPTNYVVTAQATDAQGVSATSAPVRFSVIALPVVTLGAPASRLALGTNLILSASVAPGGAAITSVEFFATRLVSETGELETVSIGSDVSPPYSISWLPITPGAYFLSATALDELGQTGQSSTVSVRVFVLEQVLPTISLTGGPPNFARVAGSPINLSGTATDNLGLDHIEYQLSSGPLLQNVGIFLPIDSTTNWGYQRTLATNWSAEIALAPGRNAVILRSVDAANNQSEPVTRFFDYLVQAPLTLDETGEGTVNPPLGGKMLEVGRTYTLTARPGPGQIFSGWEDGATSNVPTLSFQMAFGLRLLARFEPDRFPAGSTYNGLFFQADTNLFQPESSGLFTLQLAKRGLFAGKIVIAGKAFPFHGQFDPTGHAEFAVVRQGLPPVAISPVLNLDAGADTIEGTVTTLSDSNPLTLPLLARRNIFNPRTNPAPQAGRRSFVVRQPAGDSNVVIRAVATISTSGKAAILAGLTSTGQIFSFGSSLAGDGAAPFYLSVAARHELFMGWLQFGDTASQSVSGQLFWASPLNNDVVVLQVTD